MEHLKSKTCGIAKLDKTVDDLVYIYYNTAPDENYYEFPSKYYFGQDFFGNSTGVLYFSDDVSEEQAKEILLKNTLKELKEECKNIQEVIEKIETILTK